MRLACECLFRRGWGCGAWALALLLPPNTCGANYHGGAVCGMATVCILVCHQGRRETERPMDLCNAPSPPTELEPHKTGFGRWGDTIRNVGRRYGRPFIVLKCMRPSG